MEFSVIIPAYRAQRTIARAVRSALAQSLPPKEIIIVSDDGSDYLSTLKQAGIEHTSLRQVMTEGTATGEGNARNTGIAIAKCQAIGLLDADDEYLPKRLETLAPLVKTFGAACSQIERLDEATGDALRNINHPFREEALTSNMLSLASLHGFPHFAFDRLRCPLIYDEHHRLADIIFAFSLYNCVEQVGYTSVPLYRYYRVSDSLCNAPGSGEAFMKALARMFDPKSDIHLKVKTYRAYEPLMRHLRCIVEAEEAFLADVNQAKDFEEYFAPLAYQQLAP